MFIALECSDGTYGKECQDTFGYCVDQDVCQFISMWLYLLSYIENLKSYPVD